MKIPNVSCQWYNRSTDELASCSFQVFLTKMEDIQDEFNGSPRKQTKVDTIIEGLKSVHNATAAAALVGKRFVISRSGKQLHVTTLPTSVLKGFPLPQEYEDVLKGTTTPVAKPTASGAFAAFSRNNAGGGNNAIGVDLESKRIGLAAKRMFLELGASLEVVYSDNDLLVVEVSKTPKPEALVEAVFNNGEHPEGHDNWNISFGLLKDIK